MQDKNVCETKSCNRVDKGMNRSGKLLLKREENGFLDPHSLALSQPVLLCCSFSHVLSGLQDLLVQDTLMQPVEGKQKPDFTVWFLFW